MSTKQSILLTTTSFQDVPGIHHKLLEEPGYQLIRERGPLSEERMLELVGEIDGMICGDDAITAAVVDNALPRLRVISKYGIGLDKIDVDYVTEKGIPLTFCPGVNHTTAGVMASSPQIIPSISPTNSSMRSSLKGPRSRMSW